MSIYVSDRLPKHWQLGEHLPYKQRVIGSSPIGPIDYGWIPEWPKGADCKSVGTAFEGSNPSPTT